MHGEEKLRQKAPQGGRLRAFGRGEGRCLNFQEGLKYFAPLPIIIVSIGNETVSEHEIRKRFF